MVAKELPNLRPFQFAIVGESHTLRSDTRQDYRTPRQYIRKKGSKVLLLTATP
jgi:hypothetical protein